MEERAEYTVETVQAPPLYEWLPVGIYNGVDLPDTEVDQDYVVWVKMLNPECDCEMIVS